MAMYKTARMPIESRMQRDIFTCGFLISPPIRHTFEIPAVVIHADQGGRAQGPVKNPGRQMKRAGWKAERPRRLKMR